MWRAYCSIMATSTSRGDIVDGSAEHRAMASASRPEHFISSVRRITQGDHHLARKGSLQDDSESSAV
jgi:hypothetical protein